MAGMSGARWSPSGPLPLSTVRSPAAYSLVVPVITIVIINRTTRANESSIMATSTQRRRRPKGTRPRAPIRRAPRAGWDCQSSFAGLAAFRQTH